MQARLLTSMPLLLMALALASCNKPAPPAAQGTAGPNEQATAAAPADEPAVENVTVDVKQINDKGVGASVGSVLLGDGAGGLVITANLKGLPPGPHGLHIHQNPACDPGDKDGKLTAGAKAGEHYDPNGTGRHAGPEGPGHAGDLPQLMVEDDGSSTTSTTAPKLKLAEVKGRSLMIHGGADDYGNAPGGTPIACGVIPS